MKRPGFLARLFGNPVSFIGISLAAIACFYEAWVGVVPFFVPIIALAIGAYAHSANEKIAGYNTWKAEWDSINGLPARMSFSQWLMRVPGLRYVLGLAAWGALASFAIAHAKQPDMQTPIALFWLATLLLVGGVVYRLLARGRGRQTARKNVTVTVCLLVPRQSASTAQAFAELPSYCLPLFERRDRAEVKP